MPTFRYIAVDARGATHTGTMTEETSRLVAERLREQQRFPAKIVALPSSSRKIATNEVAARPGRWTRGVSGRDLTLFSRQLSNLVKGGLPLLRSFNALIDHTENLRLQQVLIDVRDNIHSGSSLWEAMAKHGRTFPAFYVNMIRAGEASGELPAILQWLADLLETDQQKRTQIRSALAYPKLLLGVGAAAVFFLVTFLIPRFVSLFEELGQSLPLATVAVLTVSGFLGRWWWLLLLALTTFWGAGRLWTSTQRGRLACDSFRLRIPVFSRLTMKIAVARFARILSILLRGGVPILTALDVVRDVIGNERLAQDVDAARVRVREGASLAEHFRDSGLFPKLLTNMIAVGEESAELESALMTVAETYDVEVDSSVKALISVLEPTIIIFLAIVFGFIIVSMLLPVFQMNLLPTQ